MIEVRRVVTFGGALEMLVLCDLGQGPVPLWASVFLVRKEGLG